jgi:hypothetical protein
MLMSICALAVIGTVSTLNASAKEIIEYRAAYQSPEWNRRPNVDLSCGAMSQY